MSLTYNSGQGQFAFPLTWKPSATSCRVPERQHPTVLIRKKPLDECEIVTTGDLLHLWLSGAPQEAEKVEEQTEIFGVHVMTTHQRKSHHFEENSLCKTSPKVSKDQDHANAPSERNSKLCASKHVVVVTQMCVHCLRSALLSQTRSLPAQVQPCSWDLCTHSQGHSTEAPENPTNSQSPDFTNKNCFLLEECDRFHGMVGTGTWSRNAVFSWSFLTGFLEVLRTAGQHP